ncbi:hypothetical protein E5288_WYG001167 [Bos mutus]|uniref:Uncharacterized protein n=1 Tax=Bos mutus TaxID=72004 RepID=A0A6B0S316_9CETA|nr:hypothetical protein [Bos mutus]
MAAQIRDLGRWYRETLMPVECIVGKDPPRRRRLLGETHVSGSEEESCWDHSCDKGSPPAAVQPQTLGELSRVKAPRYWLGQLRMHLCELSVLRVSCWCGSVDLQYGSVTVSAACELSVRQCGSSIWQCDRQCGSVSCRCGSVTVSGGSVTVSAACELSVRQCESSVWQCDRQCGSVSCRCGSVTVSGGSVSCRQQQCDRQRRQCEHQCEPSVRQCESSVWQCELSVLRVSCRCGSVNLQYGSVTVSAAV